MKRELVINTSKNNTSDDIPCDQQCIDQNCNEWLSQYLNSWSDDENKKRMWCTTYTYKRSGC